MRAAFVAQRTVSTVLTVVLGCAIGGVAPIYGLGVALRNLICGFDLSWVISQAVMDPLHNPQLEAFLPALVLVIALYHRVQSAQAEVRRTANRLRRLRRRRKHSALRNAKKCILLGLLLAEQPPYLERRAWMLPETRLRNSHWGGQAEVLLRVRCVFALAAPPVATFTLAIYLDWGGRVGDCGGFGPPT